MQSKLKPKKLKANVTERKSCFSYEQFITFNLQCTWSLLNGETEQNLLHDFNHMLLGVFVLVIEAQKLEVCIHKQNYMVNKLSENPFTNMSDDTVLHNLWDPTENIQQTLRQTF